MFCLMDSASFYLRLYSKSSGQNSVDVIMSTKRKRLFMRKYFGPRFNNDR